MDPELPPASLAQISDKVHLSLRPRHREELGSIPPSPSPSPSALDYQSAVAQSVFREYFRLEQEQQQQRAEGAATAAAGAAAAETRR